MVLASQLRSGMAIRYERQIYKVLSSEYHPGQGKMGGVAHARLRNIATGALWEHSFRAELKLEDVPVEKQSLSFLYADADQYYFMNPITFEQMGIPMSMVGEQGKFLLPDVTLPVEFIEGQAVSIVFPDIIEAAVTATAPPAHGQQDNTWKTAHLENGIELMVPQFIKIGDIIRLDTATLKYVDRARSATK